MSKVIRKRNHVDSLLERTTGIEVGAQVGQQISTLLGRFASIWNGEQPFMFEGLVCSDTLVRIDG